MRAMQHDPLPRQSRRITLRRLALADLEAFQAYRSDPVVGRYQSWAPMSQCAAAAFLEQMSREPFGTLGEWLQIGVAERQSGRLIGDIGVLLHAPPSGVGELGVTLAREAQGRGLAAEAVGATIALLFDSTDVTHVEATTDARNLPSIRLWETIGMHRTRTAQVAFRGEICEEWSYMLARPTAPAGGTEGSRRLSARGRAT